MSPVQFFLRHHREILQATLEHVWLVGLTMIFAIAIGVPLGILVTRKPWLSKPILGGANIAEQLTKACPVAEFHARGVAAQRRINVARQRDPGVTRAPRVPDAALRAFQDGGDGNRKVCGGRHER